MCDLSGRNGEVPRATRLRTVKVISNNGRLAIYRAVTGWINLFSPSWPDAEARSKHTTINPNRRLPASPRKVRGIQELSDKLDNRKASKVPATYTLTKPGSVLTNM